MDFYYGAKKIEPEGRFLKRPKNINDYDELARRTSSSMPNPSFRNMLNNVHYRCYVEAENTRQGGEVVDVIRDRFGIPACFKVIYEIEDAWGYDYIPVTEIDLFEPYSYCVSNDEYYDDEEDEEWLLATGYRWDDEECCFINDETGDKVVW